MKIKNHLILDKCEVCGNADLNVLQLHHIIERTEINTTNNSYNLAILCGNCHLLTHAKRLHIIGVYPSTHLPNHRILIYELDGKKNVDIDVPYLETKAKSFKIYGSGDK